jgi:hypothetical protein
VVSKDSFFPFAPIVFSLNLATMSISSMAHPDTSTAYEENGPGLGHGQFEKRGIKNAFSPLGGH